MNFAQAVKNKNYACYKCGKSNHALNKCKLNIPCKEWWINRMMQAMQDKEYESDDDSNSSKEERNRNRGRNRQHSKSRNRLEWSGHQ